MQWHFVALKIHIADHGVVTPHIVVGSCHVGRTVWPPSSYLKCQQCHYLEDCIMKGEYCSYSCNDYSGGGGGACVPACVFWLVLSVSSMTQKGPTRTT